MRQTQDSGHQEDSAGRMSEKLIHLQVSEMNSAAYTLGSPCYEVGESADKEAWSSEKREVLTSWDPLQCKTSVCLVALHREDPPGGCSGPRDGDR